jgi:hypothetical protein
LRATASAVDLAITCSHGRSQRAVANPYVPYLTDTIYSRLALRQREGPDLADIVESHAEAVPCHVKLSGLWKRLNARSSIGRAARLGSVDYWPMANLNPQTLGGKPEPVAVLWT